MDDCFSEVGVIVYSVVACRIEHNCFLNAELGVEDGLRPHHFFLRAEFVQKWVGFVVLEPLWNARVLFPLVDFFWLNQSIALLL